MYIPLSSIPTMKGECDERAIGIGTSIGQVCNLKGNSTVHACIMSLFGGVHYQMFCCVCL